MTLSLKNWKNASPVTKVAVTWASWATICLTGYYFARIWAANQRVESLKIREVINDEFGDKLARAKRELELKEGT
jgi:hypothetical protein